MRPLRDLLEDPLVLKIGQDLKHDLIVLWNCGLEPAGLWFDTMVASYVLDPGRGAHALEVLAMELLAHRTIRFEEVTAKGKAKVAFAEVTVESARDYSCEGADCTLRLYERFRPQLEAQGLERLFHELEMPLVPVLARMERAGIKMDARFFQQMSTRLYKELD